MNDADLIPLFNRSDTFAAIRQRTGMTVEAVRAAYARLTEQGLVTPRANCIPRPRSRSAVFVTARRRAAQ